MSMYNYEIQPSVVATIGCWRNSIHFLPINIDYSTIRLSLKTFCDAFCRTYLRSEPMTSGLCVYYVNMPGINC